MNALQLAAKPRFQPPDVAHALLRAEPALVPALAFGALLGAADTRPA